MKQLHSILVAILCVCLCSCADIQTFLASPQGKTTKEVALNILVAAAESYATGGTINAAWAIPVALNSISTVVKNSGNNTEAAQVIQNTVTNFSSDTTTKKVAQKLASAFVAANPQTPEAREATIVALATGASQGVTIAAAQ